MRRDGSPMRLATTARGIGYRLATRGGDTRLDAIQSAFGGRTALMVLERLLERGEVTVAGGLGIGLTLSAAHLPVRHAQAHNLVRGTVEPSV